MVKEANSTIHEVGVSSVLLLHTYRISAEIVLNVEVDGVLHGPWLNITLDIELCELVRQLGKHLLLDIQLLGVFIKAHNLNVVLIL